MVLDFGLGAARELAIHLVAQVLDFALAALKACAVVVAQDVGERGTFHVALHAHEVIESLIALGVLRRFPSWQHHSKLHGHAHGVEHLVLGSTGVHVEALESDACARRVEVFIFQFANGSAVHGVCPVGAKFLHVEVMRAQSNLLVGIEADANVAVLHLGVLLQPFHGGENLGDTSLVVGTEQRSAVGDDELLAHIVVKFGELLRVEDDALLLVEHDGASLVVDDARFHVVAAHVGGGVHVGDEADGGHLLVAAVARQRGKEVAVVVERDVAQPHGVQFLLEHAGKCHLARSGRSEVRQFVALRVILHVVDKAIDE